VIEVPIIDIFAGPGGLGEGFSAFKGKDIKYQIGLSIEKDFYAHKTLELRAFYRQFRDQVPDDYYKYLHGDISRDELFANWPKEADAARAESWHHELNNNDLGLVRNKVKAVLKKSKSPHWVLIGGPPCQAYSLVGRARMGKSDNFESDERHFLYRHYLRLVGHLKPSIFVMENVKGILTASNKGVKIFDQVLSDLEHPGLAIKKLDQLSKAPSLVEYDIFSFVVDQLDQTTGKHVPASNLTPRDYIIRSENYGVPQTRHRVILLGIKRDLNQNIGFRLKESLQTSVQDAIRDLPDLRSGITRTKDSYDAWLEAIGEVFKKQNCKGIDEETKSLMQKSYASMKLNLTRGGTRVFKTNDRNQSALKSWYQDPKLKVVLNHETKGHMKTDLWRYFFSSCYALVHQRSPKLGDYPSCLLPDHKNINDKDKKFSDRFKVQVNNKPSSTITSHIRNDGHYFIHPDPTQCRALTVREAARLQTFPDNYFFEGSRSHQYHQVGNAVPPFLATQIAEVVTYQLEEIMNESPCK